MLDFNKGLSLIEQHNIIASVGNECFYRDQIKNKVIENNKGSNVVLLDCLEELEENIFSILRTPDLFSIKNIYILKNFTKIKKLDFFIENKFKDIIILDSEKSSKSKSFEKLKEAVLYIDCNKPKPWEQETDAIAKIISFIKKNECFIEEDTALYFYNKIGYNLYKLIMELKKLVLFKETNANKLVTKSDIDALCSLGLKYNVFDIIDEILKGDKNKAFDLLQKLYKYENNPSILLISLWFEHFENLLFIKNTSGDIKKIAEYTTFSPAIIQKKLIPQAEKILNEKIIDSLNYLTNIDYNLRKGSFDLRFYLEKFIIDF